jgi:hypothetical protein
MDMPHRRGPGIANIRHPHPTTHRHVSLVRTDDSVWATLFEHADIVSEGSSELENDRWVYRGTTSIIVRCAIPTSRRDLRADAPAKEQLDARVRAMMLDPHLRLRAVRVARREAQARITGTLDTVHMDIILLPEHGQIRITVDVDANVMVADGRCVKRWEQRANDV